MTNPFASTVGLKGVTSPEPAVLINDLPGISTELVGALTTTHNANAAAVWGKIQRLGYEKLRSMIEGELSKSADFRYTSNPTGCLVGEGLDLITLPLALYRGYQFRVRMAATDEVFLSSMALDSAAEEAVQTVIVAFSATGEELLNLPVTVQPGYNELSIDTAIKSRFGRDALAFVGVDCTKLPLRSLGLSQQWDGASAFDPAEVYTAEGHAVAFWLGAEETTTMLTAYVRRSLGDVIARYAGRLQWAYAYVCGSLLMAEKLGNSNLNLFTNTNRTYTEDREAKFMDETAILVKPIARDMLKELVTSSAVSPITERVVDQGYSMEGFV